MKKLTKFEIDININSMNSNISSNSNSSEMITDEATSSHIEMLLERTRYNIQTGDRDNALANLINAIALSKGPDAIFSTLSDAREAALEESRKKEELAFNRTLLDVALKSSDKLVNNDSILKDMGDQEILRDVFEVCYIVLSSSSPPLLLLSS